MIKTPWSYETVQSTLTAKTPAKIKVSADKIHYNFCQKHLKIIQICKIPKGRIGTLTDETLRMCSYAWRLVSRSPSGNVPTDINVMLRR